MGRDLLKIGAIVPSIEFKEEYQDDFNRENPNLFTESFEENSQKNSKSLNFSLM